MKLTVSRIILRGFRVNTSQGVTQYISGIKAFSVKDWSVLGLYLNRSIRDIIQWPSCLIYYLENMRKAFLHEMYDEHCHIFPSSPKCVGKASTPSHLYLPLPLPTPNIVSTNPHTNQSFNVNDIHRPGRIKKDLRGLFLIPLCLFFCKGNKLSSCYTKKEILHSFQLA